MSKAYKKWGLWLAGLALALAAPWFLDVVATKAVAEACKSRRIGRFVFASTDSV